MEAQGLHSNSAPRTAPVMDVVARGQAAQPAAAPTAPAQDPAVAPAPPQAKQHNQKAPAPAKPAKQPSNNTGVGLAIFATVIIVLGLAAMATYAYIKTK